MLGHKRIDTKDFYSLLKQLHTLLLTLKLYGKHIIFSLRGLERDKTITTYTLYVCMYKAFDADKLSLVITIQISRSSYQRQKDIHLRIGICTQSHTYKKLNYYHIFI